MTDDMPLFLSRSLCRRRRACETASTAEDRMDRVMHGSSFPDADIDCCSCVLSAFAS